MCWHPLIYCNELLSKGWNTTNDRDISFIPSKNYLSVCFSIEYCLFRMKRETKSIALFDDGSKVSTYLKLHFQNTPGFSVTRVYSRDELEHRMKKAPVDIIIAPARNPVHAYSGGCKGARLCLFWSAVQPGKTVRSRDRLSFLFEIETPDTSLLYHSSRDESITEQFDSLGRLLARIDRYHRDFVRFQADTEILQSIVEETMTGILSLIRNRIQWTNREAQRMLGCTGKELTGKEFSSLFPDDRHYREAIGQISRNRGSGGWGWARCPLVDKSGEVVECTIRMRRLNPMNAEKGSLILIEDDREKRHLEWAIGKYQEKMAKNEMKYLEALWQMDQVIIKTDPNGAITFWNTRAESTFGFTAGEVTGKNIVAVTCDTGSRSAKDMAVLLYDPGPGHENAPLQILENRKKDGGLFWTAWNTLPCRDITGTMAGIVWIGQDITDGDPSRPSTSMTGPWKQQLLEGTDVAEEVFDILFHTAIQLGRGAGNQGRSVPPL